MEEGVAMQSVEKSRRKKWRDFEEAREFVRSLGLKNQKAWHEYSRSEQKPNDIPTNPQRTYKAQWQGWGDWLGTDAVYVGNRQYIPFEEARRFVRSLGLTSYKEWMGWRKSGDKPDDIPSNPNLVYKDVGWLGYGDWLGTGKVRRGKEEWLPFEEARAFARTLGLKNEAQWREYCRSGQKPVDVPANLAGVYKDKWRGMGDFLGTGNIANRYKVFQPFEEAREFVRSLGLKTAQEWYEYARSPEKPEDIPFNPDQVYGDKWKRR
jgi:Phage-integrase repeat unit